MKCPDCLMEVSEKAHICIHCGHMFRYLIDDKEDPDYIG